MPGLPTCPQCGSKGLLLFSSFACDRVKCVNHAPLKGAANKMITFAVAGHQVEQETLNNIFEHINPADKSDDFCDAELEHHGTWICTREACHPGPCVAHEIDADHNYWGVISAVWEEESTDSDLNGVKGFAREEV